MPNRRDVLKSGLSAAALGFLGRAGLPVESTRQIGRRLGNAAGHPFLQLPPNPASVIVDGIPFEPWFTGDDFPDPESIPFHTQWQGTPPAPSEDVDVAIVGGGISGLASAYLLRRHHPVVFDLRSRFGGNAQGEKWRGTRSSLGSAYVIAPDEDSWLERLYHRLRLDEVREESFPPDPVELYGQIQPGFWTGAGLSPAEQAAFASYAGVVSFMANEAYPEIPLPDDPRAAAFVRELDTRSFRQDVEQRMGMPMTPLLAAGVQAYFYSSFGAGMESISAASGWNFVAAEEFGRWIFPGGNAWMAAAFWKKLQAVEASLPSSAAPLLRPNCRIVDVRNVGNRVVVTWIDGSGNTQALRAKYVVMAGSKHVCKYVLHDLVNLDNDKFEAMAQIGTAAYVVASVLIDAPASAPNFDLFLIHDASFPMTELAFQGASRPIDAVDGNYALDPDHPRSVLSFYWPLPFPSARFTLMLDEPHAAYAQAFVPHLIQALGVLGVPVSAVKQVRLARWGHAMPIAKPHLIFSGVPEQLLRPFQNRTFFVNQDNWALPAVENSLLDAKYVTDQIDDLL